jgi:hypothetical protein
VNEFPCTQHARKGHEPRTSPFRWRQDGDCSAHRTAHAGSVKSGTGVLRHFCCLAVPGAEARVMDAEVQV